MKFVTESDNNSCWKGTKDFSGTTSCSDRVSCRITPCFQGPYRAGYYKTFKDGDCTISLGKLLQCLTVLVLKKFFLMSSLIFLFQLMTVVLSSSHSVLSKSMAPSSQCSFLVGSRGPVVTFPWSHLSSRLDKPSPLSLSLPGEWPSLDHPGSLPLNPYLCCSGRSKTGCNTLDVVWWMQSRGPLSLPLTVPFLVVG